MYIYIFSPLDMTKSVAEENSKNVEGNNSQKLLIKISFFCSFKAFLGQYLESFF